MAHRPYGKLADREAELGEIRTWPHLRQKSPGVFTLKSLPFLHFHVRDDARWADARCGKRWGPRIALGSTAAARRRFLRTARRYYEERLWSTSTSSTKATSAAGSGTGRRARRS